MTGSVLFWLFSRKDNRCPKASIRVECLVLSWLLSGIMVSLLYQRHTALHHHQMHLWYMFTHCLATFIRTPWCPLWQQYFHQSLHQTIFYLKANERCHPSVSFSAAEALYHVFIAELYCQPPHPVITLYLCFETSTGFLPINTFKIVGICILFKELASC